jgi:hypothetical protein
MLARPSYQAALPPTARKHVEVLVRKNWILKKRRHVLYNPYRS